MQAHAHTRTCSYFRRMEPQFPSPFSNPSVITLLQTTPGFLFFTSKLVFIHSERKAALIHSMAPMINAAPLLNYVTQSKPKKWCAGIETRLKTVQRRRLAQGVKDIPASSSKYLKLSEEICCDGQFPNVHLIKEEAQKRMCVSICHKLHLSLFTKFRINRLSLQTPLQITFKISFQRQSKYINLKYLVSLNDIRYHRITCTGPCNGNISENNSV